MKATGSVVLESNRRIDPRIERGYGNAISTRGVSRRVIAGDAFVRSWAKDFDFIII